jgi:hypothetical protein
MGMTGPVVAAGMGRARKKVGPAELRLRLQLTRPLRNRPEEEAPMTRRTFTLVTAAVALLAGCAFAQAQQVATVDIGFTFVVAGTALPPGTYRIVQTDDNSIAIRREASNTKAIEMPVITILGRRDADRFPELVFDKVSGVVSLSEIWFADSDGYLVLATKGPHEHVILQSK